MKTLQELVDMPLGTVTGATSGKEIERVPDGWLWAGTFIPEPLSATAASFADDVKDRVLAYVKDSMGRDAPVAKP